VFIIANWKRALGKVFFSRYLSNMMLVTLKFGVSKIMFKKFKEQRFCNKKNLKTKKNIPEVIERVIEVGEII
jgi:hypothetical protein